MELGLRERKKAATRLAISNVATALFAERGFEAVTLAEIAAAADVSVKTILNHFTTKEELFYDRAEQVFGSLVAAIVERPAGVPILEALRRRLADHRVPFEDDGWDDLHDGAGFERFRRFLATEHASSALRARRLVIASEWVDRLTSVLAAELGLGPDDARVRSLAAFVVAALEQRGRAIAAAVLTHAPGAEVERVTRAAVDEAFGRLATAYADLDRPRV